MKLQTEKCPILPQQRAFGQEVCMKRSQCGFTQEQMAEYLSISVGEYKKIECCGHIPKTGRFLFICRRLRLEPLDYLMQAWDQEEQDVSLLDEEAETV